MHERALMRDVMTNGNGDVTWGDCSVSLDAVIGAHLRIL